jgi:branched-subunit amino acid aminotransferase/4-amino-4-deoxychorismate lyase
MSNLCYFNGTFLPLGETRLPLTDLALQRGYGVFEYFRTVNGDLFHALDHLKRFRKSAAALHLPVHRSDQEMIEIILHLVDSCDYQQPAVRIMLTGGDPTHQQGVFNPRLICFPEELPVYPPELYTQGLCLLTVRFQREMPLVKTLNYAASLRWELLLKRQHADDLLYFSGQGVSEAPRSNFFLFRNGKLITPANNILFGITRQIVLNLARGHFPIEERLVSEQELREADEAFLTSTSKGIMPVTQINQHPVGDGKTGECTHALHGLYQSYLEEYQSNLDQLV